MSDAKTQTTQERQLDAWVEGKPFHNTEDDECCPDFSCCQPHLLQPVEVRKAFRDRPELRNGFLMQFLSTAFSNERVHIAGYHYDQ